MPEVTIVAHDIGPVGGMELVLSKLVTGLAAAGDQVTVIARTSTGLDGLQRVTVHHVRGPRRPFLLAYPWFGLAAAMALTRHRRGVVQTTGAIVPGAVDVISVHLLHHARGIRDGGSRASRGSLLFRAHARVAAAVSRAAERWAYRPARGRAFVAVSDGVAAELRELFPALSDRVVAIPNGVDTEKFRPDPDARARRAELGLPADGLLALFVGGEWARKGLGAAIEALGLARAWGLAVVGAGDLDAYQQLAQQHGVLDRVHFLGVRSDVAALYRAADAFLLPTRYETFSLATYEAAASGLPIVAGNVSGINDLVEDGRSGFLVPPVPADLAARLDVLAADAELRKRMGGAAREASLRFGWDAMVERHRDLYARLRAEEGNDAQPSR